ncbi:MAG: DUF1501 domain-containing protein [Roseinatronobacter sp.]
MTRRSMLGVTAALFSSAFLPRMASGATDPDARLLVVVLRGGMDGINMMVPKLDPRYGSVRGNLAIPTDATLSLGSDFGLHPGLARVHDMWARGDVALVPAAGIPLQNRSHFDCQDNLENGLPQNTANATGWLNRMLGALPAGDPVRQLGAIEIGDAPLILRGREPVLGWSPTWFQKLTEAQTARLRHIYGAVDPELLSSLERGLRADQIALAAGADNPDVSVLRRGFIGAARLMRAESGPRISVLSVGGWDTHVQQGGLTGQFNDRLRQLDEGLADVEREMGAAWANTVVICVTEFGRTVLANGDSGTDHGIATVAMLVGGAVRQGIFGDWPGLATQHLLDGDLRPTVDLRAVFKGVMQEHLGIPRDVLESTVFPGSLDARPLDGLIKHPVPAAARGRMAFSRQPDRADHPIAAYRAARH